MINYVQFNFHYFTFLSSIKLKIYEFLRVFKKIFILTLLQSILIKTLNDSSLKLEREKILITV